MEQTINIFNVVSLLYDEFSSKKMTLSPYTDKEINLKNQIVEMLKNYGKVNSTDLIANQERLSLDTAENPGFSSLENKSSDYTSSEDNMQMKQLKKISWKNKEAAVKYWRGTKMAKSHNFKSVRNQFKFIKSETQLYRLEKQALPVWMAGVIQARRGSESSYKSNSVLSSYDLATAYYTKIPDEIQSPRKSKFSQILKIKDII